MPLGPLHLETALLIECFAPTVSSRALIGPQIHIFELIWWAVKIEMFTRFMKWIACSLHKFKRWKDFLLLSSAASKKLQSVV